MVEGITFPKPSPSPVRDAAPSRVPSNAGAAGDGAKAIPAAVKEGASLSQESVRELIARRDTRVVLFRDHSSGRIVGQIMDRGSGRVIAQYPPDELLSLYASVKEDLRGQFEITV